MIEGTTPENFQCNCGGWNCRHQLVPVADAVVPAALRAKFAKPAPTEPAPEPAKPTPIDTKPYQEAMQRVYQYSIDHPRSAKIKGYLNGIMKAVTDGDEKQLQDLLKQAQADIAKFQAAAKAVAKKKGVATTPTPAATTPTAPATTPITPTFTPAAPLKAEYKSLKGVKSSMTDINNVVQWFKASGKVGELKKTRKRGINGQTIRATGEIDLTPDRADYVISAFDKIAKGKAEDITSEEAATYWHEITHNRHHSGYDSSGAPDSDIRRYMETANEYIARETMDEFYNALGVPTPKNAIPYKTTRHSTGYQKNVEKVQNLITIFECDKTMFNSKLKDSLFNGAYDELQKGLTIALFESGAKNMVYDKKGNPKMPTAITMADCREIIKVAIGDQLPLVDLKHDIARDFPNLRKKT